jgi:hypothetical protein
MRPVLLAVFASSVMNGFHLKTDICCILIKELIPVVTMMQLGV